MALAVEMRDIVVEPLREATRPSARSLLLLLLRTARPLMLMRRPTRILRPLLALRTPPPTAIKRRRRALELRAPSAEAGGGAAAGRGAGAAVGARGVVVPVIVVLGCGAQEVLVVAGALVGAAEDVVGFRDFDEAFRGLGVVGVAVGVVCFA